MSGSASRPLADAAARAAIRTNLDVTMMVEAAAGTGKTTILVDRMIGLVRSGRCGVNTLAAITFTVKAASHLRNRFREQLQKALTTSDGQERQRISDALGQIERCFIGTTHAFCARLLRERPIEASVDPEFTEVEASEARVLTNRFYEAFIERAVARGDEHLTRLRTADISIEKMKDSFRTLTGFPDVRMHFDEAPQPDLDGAFMALNSFLDEIKPELPTDLMRVKQDGFEELMRKLLRHRGGRDFDDVRSKLQLLEDANHKSIKPTQRNWSDTADGKLRIKQTGLAYVTLVTGTIAPALIQWREYVHGLVLQFLQPGVVEFAQERRRNGTLTFEDLLLHARDLLRDHATVRRYFQKRFTHLLVDEFQDTDPLQAEVMFYLTGEDVEELRWKELRPRRGSLFVVGDPKQSIYRFRRADISTYLEVRERIVESGGELLQLSTNFRSFPSICSWVNRNFSVMFSPDDVSLSRQAAHVDLHAHRSEGAMAGVFRLETPAQVVGGVAQAEAESLTRWIRDAVHGGTQIETERGTRALRWGDILLVSWGKSNIGRYARALEAAGIPYEVTGGKSFSASEELRTLLPLLRCLLDSEDSISVAAFLRGPLCGIDDQALYEFARAGGRFTVYVKVPEVSDTRLKQAFDLLRSSSSEAQKLPPAAALARLFDRIGVFASASAQLQSGTRGGNLLYALSRARKLSAQGGSLAEVVEQIETLLEPASEIEEMDVDPVRADAVRLMNLHQVKGLEAPVVFLIDPRDIFRHPVESFIDRSGTESIGYFGLFEDSKFSRRAMALPRGWAALESRETSFKLAEEKRALYVAATRAQNMLILGIRRSAWRDEGAWSQYVDRPADSIPMLPEVSAQGQLRFPHTIDFSPVSALLAESYERGRDSSYSVLPITKLVKGNHAELLRSEEGLGRGTSWGRVMHRLLEAILRRPSLDVELYARNLLKDEERDAAEVGDVLQLIAAVRRSPVWSRVLESEERYVEVPFAITVDSAEFGLDGPARTLLHGAIDLVFRESDEWFVVDYKSDSTAGRLESLVEYYKPQVEHYARFWQQLTTQRTSAGLFFVDSGEMVWV